MAGVLVYTLNFDHPSLHQEIGQGPSGVCGRETALPPRNGPAPVFVPSVGIFASVSYPELCSGHLRAHCSYDKKTLCLLAQGPAMDHELLYVHPYRHPGCGSLPPSA